MSTNISEIMFEMEQAGMPRDRVNDLVVRLLKAGQATVYAQQTEQARRRIYEDDPAVTMLRR